MKTLDVAGTGKRPAPAQPAAAAVTKPPSRDVLEVMRRQARVNAEADAARAQRAAEFDGRWLTRRPGWLGR